MVNSKKRRHSAICNDCNGNGYTSNKSREIIIQCETCDSEGEYYVHEPETFQPDNAANNMANDVIKLH